MQPTTITVSAINGSLLAEDDGTATLLVNLDANNTVFLANTASVAVDDTANNVPLGPGATLVVDGSRPWYGAVKTGLSAQVAVIPGGVSFFQIVELIIKTLIINASQGNGLFVYNGTGSAGNPPILAVVGPGTTQDPFGNTVKAVLNIGNFSASHIGWDANGNTYVSGPDGVTRVFIANGSIPTGPHNNMDPAIWFFNDFGAVVLVVDPSSGGIFQYQDNGSAVQGTLIGSQTFKSGGANDPVFNLAVPAGVFLNDPVFSDSIQIVGGNINWNLAPFSKVANDTINQGSGSTSPYRHISAPEQGQVGHIVQRWYGTSVDGTVPPGSVISSTDPPVRHTSEMLEVQGTAVLTEILAFTPGSTSTEETWHPIPGFGSNGWSIVAGQVTPNYRMLPDGNVQIVGAATHASFSANTQFSTALPVAYRPTSEITAAGNNNTEIEITTAGIINIIPSGAQTATQFSITYPVNI